MKCDWGEKGQCGGQSGQPAPPPRRWQARSHAGRTPVKATSGQGHAAALRHHRLQLGLLLQQAPRAVAALQLVWVCFMCVFVGAGAGKRCRRLKQGRVRPPGAARHCQSA